MPAPNPAPAPALDAAALAQIRARADAATPGPWKQHISYDGDFSGYVSNEPGLKQPTHKRICYMPDGYGSPNQVFIAHARADIPALIAEVERLNAEVARLADAEMVSWLMMQQLIYQGRATPRVYRLSGSAAWHLEWYDHSRVTRRDSTAGAFEMPTLENLPPEDRAQIADAFAKWKEARDAR